MKNRKVMIILFSILFILLAILVKLDLLSTIDTFVYELFNITDVNTKVFKIFTFFGSTLFIILLCVFFFILFIILKKKNYSYIIASTLVISTILNNVIKIIIRRERPLVLRLVEESSFSFPSGHMMASVSLYGILLYLVLKSNIKKSLKIFLSIFLGVLPVLVGMSRIYLGAHFFSDIIGALLVSLILLLIVIDYIEKKNLLVVKYKKN